MSGVAKVSELRIGDVARLAGTTPRTIRYYEEIGLLPASGARERGAHRTYTAADVDRLTELLRVKSLLGISIEALKQLDVADKLKLVRRRRDELASLERKLLSKRKRLRE